MLSDIVNDVPAPALVVGGAVFSLFLFPYLNSFNYSRKVKAAGGVHAPQVKGPPFSGWRLLIGAAQAAREHRVLAYFNEGFERFATPECPNCIEANPTGGRRYFVTRDPEHIKTILTGKFADYGKGPDFHRLWRPFLGDSIFATDGKQWLDSRQLIRPMFIKDRISDLDTFDRHTQKMMSLFAGPGQPTDLMDLFYRMTLDVTTEFLLGDCINSLDNPKGDFVQAFATVQRIQMMLQSVGPLEAFVPRGEYNRAIKTMNDFVYPFVHQTLSLAPEEVEKRGKSDKDFTFLHALARYTRDPVMIRDQIVSVLLAGRDTTAATLSWTFYEMSHYPEIWAKLRKEVLDTVGPTRAPTYENLKNMKYLKNTINEGLRLYPAVPYNLRFALADTTLPTGGGPNGDLPISVVKGDSIVYSAYAMQRREDLYPPPSESFAHPHIFSPERWEVWQPKPWHYIPFNGGPRICIGQNFALAEMQFVLTRLVQRFERIEYVGNWEEQFHKAEIVGAPGQGVKIAFYPARDQKQG